MDKPTLEVGVGDAHVTCRLEVLRCVYEFLVREIPFEMRAFTLSHDLWTVGVGSIEDVHAAEVVVAQGDWKIKDGAVRVRYIIPSATPLTVFEDSFAADGREEEPVAEDLAMAEFDRG